VQSLTSIGPLKSGGRYYWWIAVLTELQFFRYLPFWVPLFMQCNNFWLVHTGKYPFLPIFSATKLGIILNILASKTTRSLKRSLVKFVIEAGLALASAWPDQKQFCGAPLNGVCRKFWWQHQVRNFWYERARSSTPS